MRTILFAGIAALLASACINAGQPALNANTIPPQPETPGSSPNPEQQGTAFSISTDAYYQASLHSPSSPGRIISLSLSPERKAKMTTDFLDTKAVVADSGKWTTMNNGNLLLHLGRKGADTLFLEFKTDGDKLIYTGSEYGTAGLTLWVKHLPTEQ